MSRFFIGGLDAKARSTFVMDGDNARHAIQVLRYAVGDILTVCDGANRDCTCSVKSIRKNALVLEVLECKPNKNEPNARIYLFMALLKSDKFDYVIQKAVELGCLGIYPFESANCVVKIKSGERTLRHAKIAESAAKQCGRGIIPQIHSPLGFGQAVERARTLNLSTCLAAHEKSTLPLKKLLQNTEISDIAVFIGPEGGFIDEEIARFAAAGIVPVSLCKRVLRAETAAVAVLANIFYELGE